jgi:hypothetical protein
MCPPPGRRGGHATDRRESVGEVAEIAEPALARDRSDGEVGAQQQRLSPPTARPLERGGGAHPERGTGQPVEVAGRQMGAPGELTDTDSAQRHR